MGREYTVTVDAVAVSAAQDLFEIIPASNKAVEIMGLFIGQTSDVGDAQDENIQIKIIRGHTTSGSGGSSATPVAINPGDSAAGLTAEINNTTVASAGTPVTIHADVFNVRAGYSQWWIPRTEPQCSSTESRIVVRISASADALTLSATLYVREM